MMGSVPRLIVDASNWQQELNVRLIRQHAHGLYHKATEGLGFVDSYHRQRKLAAHQLGLPFGSYHFAQLDASPVEQARVFCTQALPFPAEALLPVLDLEAGNPAAAEPWAKAWLHEVRVQSGVWPILYSYPDYLARMRLGMPLGNGLWLASYGKDDGRDYPYMTPAPWRKVRLHQFTSVGRLAGVAVTLDLSHTRRLPFAHPAVAHLHGFRA
jgi:lysozyme